jgi:hypothetical protein
MIYILEKIKYLLIKIIYSVNINLNEMFVRNWKLFKESLNNNQYNSKNLITEICVSMILLNNEFLDNILDRGLKARYNENSSVFLTDLKNLVLSKNRLYLGKWDGEKFISDNESSKINGIFESIGFEIEKDWNVLVNSRITARNIIDKLLVDDKLTSDKISKIFWLGPNKNEDFNEDIIIETNDGRQFSLFLNKNLSLQKTSSFNTFADDIIPNGIENLYSEENLRKWDKLTQEFVRITYECSNKIVQEQIEKFIDVDRIDSLKYFEYFDIKHRDPRFKNLGEYIKQFEKNILKFSELMDEIWKKKEVHLSSLERAEKEWTEVKIVVLNSRILEHLLTSTLKSDNPEEVDKLEDGFKRANGTVKMKLMKTLVDKLGCVERKLYYLSKNGNNFYQMPSREFFRENYDELDLHFDYHQKFKIKEDDEDEDINDFTFKIKLLHLEKELISLNIVISFKGEFSNKLSAKYKFDIPENFNYQVDKIKEGEDSEYE